MRHQFTANSMLNLSKKNSGNRSACIGGTFFQTAEPKETLGWHRPSVEMNARPTSDRHTATHGQNLSVGGPPRHQRILRLKKLMVLQFNPDRL